MVNNANSVSKEEIKKISLEILKSVAKFCEKNNIKYFLVCGTLLGAVRHKGFIPWDDDVDIAMPRPDYNRFLKEYSDDVFKICNPEEGRHYYAKVYDTKTIKYENGIDYKKYYPLGVDIDVFPLDGIVNDNSIVQKMYKRAKVLETLLKLSNQPLLIKKSPLSILCRLVTRTIGSKRLVKMIENNAQKYSYNESDYVIRMRYSFNGFTGALKKDVYEPAIKIEFENTWFYAPRDYDKWLSVFFGDYNKLPPEEERIPAHNAECYYK